VLGQVSETPRYSEVSWPISSYTGLILWHDLVLRSLESFYLLLDLTENELFLLYLYIYSISRNQAVITYTHTTLDMTSVFQLFVPDSIRSCFFKSSTSRGVSGLEGYFMNETVT